MNLFKCRMCGDKIEKWDYQNKVYCSNKCRVQAYRLRKGKSSPKINLRMVEGVTGGGD